jgi:hypothetical protein
MYIIRQATARRVGLDAGSVLCLRITCTNQLHYFLLIYFDSKSLHVSSRFAAHHQEAQLCINSNWYSQHNGYNTKHVQQNFKSNMSFSFWNLTPALGLPPSSPVTVPAIYQYAYPNNVLLKGLFCRPLNNL